MILFIAVAGRKLWRIFIALTTFRSLPECCVLRPVSLPVFWESTSLLWPLKPWKGLLSIVASKKAGWSPGLRECLQVEPSESLAQVLQDWLRHSNWREPVESTYVYADRPGYTFGGYPSFMRERAQTTPFDWPALSAALNTSNADASDGAGGALKSANSPKPLLKKKRRTK